jgi:hypothetical protein
MCGSRRGFELDIGFIGHSYTRRGTVSNFSSIANLHNLQITTAHAKLSPAYCVFTSRSLVSVSNSGDFSAFALKSSVDGGSFPTVSLLLHTPVEN